MKSLIDVVIGNPPYQILDNSYGAGARPVYNLFIEKSIIITNRFNAMIVPARWYVNGKGLSKFRKAMLSDTRLSKIIDYPESKECFKGVSVKGGICILLMDVNNNKGQFIRNFNESTFKKRDFSEYDTLIRCNKSINIVRKLDKEKSIYSKISSVSPFGLPTNFNNYKEDGLKVYRRGGVSYCDQNDVTKGIDIIDKYKVIITNAYGCGTMGKVLNNPIIAKPGEICTATYIVLDVFDDKDDAKNFISYLNTKFFRFLVSMIKTTQQGARGVYRFVPQQDYKNPWNDKELYEKYGLDVDEIEHIEKSIRAMK